VDFNCEQIIKTAKVAYSQRVQIVVFPELCITTYSTRDLVRQHLLLRKAMQRLIAIREESKGMDMALIVGLPIMIDSMLINAAAVVYNGNILGIVPKSYLPESGEFEEGRWYRPGADLISKEIDIDNVAVPVGVDLLFRPYSNSPVVLAVEICEDAWTPVPPGAFHALAGATIIVNPSASNELVGKSQYREDLVRMHSATRICGYVYASAGVHESTTDVVFGGHCIIAENGVTLAQSELFDRKGTLIAVDLDMDKLFHDRINTKSFGGNTRVLVGREYRTAGMHIEPRVPSKLLRPIDVHPFTSTNPSKQKHIVDTVFEIQVAGLCKKLEQTGMKDVVIGNSGGKDSALALLVCVKAFQKLGLPLTGIHAYSLPGFGTSNDTQSFSRKLAEACGVSFEEISIVGTTTQILRDIKHDGVTQDITYENAQARARTYILFQKANQLRALVIGTGDLSEIAKGWCTFNADHIAHYNVNCGVPKGLVKYILDYVIVSLGIPEVQEVLHQIRINPDSPELTHQSDGKISQVTEDKVGPWILTEFFLYEFVRWGSEPKKIEYLARQGFGNEFTEEIIRKWLIDFYMRFFGNQWKRSVATDGPQVGSVSLSPRGKWRMPSDAEVTMWLNELK
jgi:NAD+ synthase (glutamine-hydrolysing)